MEARLAGSVIVLRIEQYSKPPSSIVFTLLGITISSNLLYPKAPVPIVSKESGRISPLSLQVEKASSGISVTSVAEERSRLKNA